MKKVSKASSKKMNYQAGWTTMEYVVGAIALVSVVSAVITIFGQKLMDAINTLVIK